MKQLIIIMLAALIGTTARVSVNEYSGAAHDGNFYILILNNSFY